MGLDDISEDILMRAKQSDFFQFIKEGNSHVAVGYQFGKTRDTLGPIFQDPSEKLEFST